MSEPRCVKADGHNPDYVTWADYKDHAEAAARALVEVVGPSIKSDVTFILAEGTLLFPDEVDALTDEIMQAVVRRLAVGQ